MKDEEIAREFTGSPGFWLRHMAPPDVLEAIATALRSAHAAGYAEAREQAAEVCWKEWKEVKDSEAAGGTPVPLYAMACQDCAEAIRAMEPKP